jgi:hypothetical protein
MKILVSEELMEATWMMLGESNQANMLRQQKTCMKEQQALTEFVFANVRLYEQGVGGILVYVFIVLAVAFRQSKAKFAKVTAAAIMQNWQEVEGIIAAMKAQGDAEYDFQSYVEPAVFRYAYEALTEEEGDAVKLTDEQLWHCLQVLLTAASCLHGAQK